MSGAVPLPPARPSGRVARRRCPCIRGAGGVGLGTQNWPQRVRSCQPALRAVGMAGVRPQGGCLVPLGGASEVRGLSPARCLLSGRALGVHCPPAVGAGVRAWGPGTVPLACVPWGGCTPRGWREVVAGG